MKPDEAMMLAAVTIALSIAVLAGGYWLDKRANRK